MATSATRARRSPAGEAWTIIAELFRADRPRFLAIAAEFELSPPQATALATLDPEQPMPMSELAGTLRCDNSNVTGIVDRLEERGLVERRAAEHDRRVKRLHLTEEGAGVQAALRARLEEPPEALKSLSAADQRALRDLLRRATEAQRKGPGPV